MNIETLRTNIRVIIKWAKVRLGSEFSLIVLGILALYFLFCKEWTLALILLLLCCILAFLLILCISRGKKIVQKNAYCVQLPTVLTYEDVIASMNENRGVKHKLTIDKNNTIITLADRRLEYRTMVSYVDVFSKHSYDITKKHTNAIYNKKFHPKQWNTGNGFTRMRCNIIVTDTVNDALNCYISTDAAMMLRRVEGIMNFVICGDILYIPPILRTEDTEIWRYRRCIRFVLRALNTDIML